MTLATRLGGRLAGGITAGVATGSRPLAQVLSAGRRGEEVVVPVLGRMRLELVGETMRQEIEAAVYRAMKARDMALDLVTAERFEAERAVRTLAEAARDPEDRSLPFGTLEEWGALDSDLVNLAWSHYGDVRERLDPLAGGLTEDERLAITAAVKKKDAMLLRTFGLMRLSAWLATTDALPSSSPEPSSSNSDSSPTDPAAIPS